MSVPREDCPDALGRFGMTEWTAGDEDEWRMCQIAEAERQAAKWAEEDKE